MIFPRDLGKTLKRYIKFPVKKNKKENMEMLLDEKIQVIW